MDTNEDIFFRFISSCTVRKGNIRLILFKNNDFLTFFFFKLLLLM